MPITFGSVGDIISTIQIAIQLLTALNESRGSAREFRDLVKSLTIFYGILEQVYSRKPTFFSSERKNGVNYSASLSRSGPLDPSALS
jgi:hypothetical protein